MPQYAAALALALLAGTGRALLGPLLEDQMPFLPFLAAAVLAAWLGGLGPGLLATAVGAVAGTWFLLAPQSAWIPQLAADWLQLAFFAATGALVAVLFDHVQGLQRRLGLGAALCDHSGDALLAWERDGTLRYWNRAAERLYGFPAAEAIGQDVHRLLATEPAGWWRAALARLEAGGEWRSEVAHRTRDGRRVQVECRLARVDAGPLVIEANRDLSARRRVELELQERELQLAIAVERSGLHPWAIDLDSRRVAASRQAFALQGMPGVEQATLDEVLARVHPDDLARVESALAQAMAGERELHETYRVAHGGFESRWVHVVGRREPYLRPGSPPGERLLGFIQDVTATRSAELELGAREAQLRLLTDSIPQLAWMARPDGWVFWYNRRWYEYTGTTPDEMEGWGWQKVHDPFELPRVTASYRRAMATGEPWEDTFPLRRHDGAMRWHLTRALPLKEPDGRISLWFGTNTDITERLEMEEALRVADRRKDEFLATLAHELRNPLAPLGNGLQILGRPDVEPATIERVSGMMVRQLGQMVRLIDDLLDVSRITRGQLELRRTRVELREVLDTARDTARPAIETAGHRFETALPEEPVWLDADPARLVQVFGNLYSNAAKYTPPGGTIRVAARRDGDHVEVRVTDTGIGIARESLERVFELFAQVRANRDEHSGGLGIGLSLVRAFVRMHGGTVRAESPGPGRGATFVVRLPVAGAPVADAPATGARVAAPAGRGGGRVAAGHRGAGPWRARGGGGGGGAVGGG
ncbi:MAG: PAS domain S-box protein, partial [Pseudomonadota bacterium]